VEFSLHPFDDFPLQATETTTTPTGQYQTPGVTVAIPLNVPALPRVPNVVTVANYGPMLIPQSGIVTSESTRSVPYDSSGSATEHQKVTVTISRAE
jgi:hypothetical protein